MVLTTTMNDLLQKKVRIATLLLLSGLSYKCLIEEVGLSNTLVVLTSNLVISEIAERLELHNNKEVIKLVQNETARFIITISMSKYMILILKQRLLTVYKINLFLNLYLSKHFRYNYAYQTVCLFSFQLLHYENVAILMFSHYPCFVFMSAQKKGS